MSCHMSGLEARVGFVELMAVSRLSRRPLSAAALSVRRPPSSTSASEALESLSPGGTMALLHYVRKTGCWFPIEDSGRAYLDYRLGYRLVLTRYH